MALALPATHPADLVSRAEDIVVPDKEHYAKRSDDIVVPDKQKYNRRDAHGDTVVPGKQKY
ncbi:hypothetical protein PT974_08163 [Cladobotryum mycophilum]|uniref:Uncharacterized protein n=1 Tax=Cladobotryum mycophilum TaxID=491253 RepID=A0ABR0SDQ8_9HYPO